jgi:hypothetical protein
MKRIFVKFVNCAIVIVICSSILKETTKLKIHTHTVVLKVLKRFKLTKSSNSSKYVKEKQSITSNNSNLTSLIQF